MCGYLDPMLVSPFPLTFTLLQVAIVKVGSRTIPVLMISHMLQSVSEISCRHVSNDSAD